jgi:hypothetical protein
MDLDTILSLASLVLSVGALIAAGLSFRNTLIVVLAALVCTTGVAVWLAYVHEREVVRVKSELKTRLDGNRWTFERIKSEMRDPDMILLREALTRALEDGTIGDRRADCVENDGTVLATRVYFNTAPK